MYGEEISSLDGRDDTSRTCLDLFPKQVGDRYPTSRYECGIDSSHLPIPLRLPARCRGIAPAVVTGSQNRRRIYTLY